MCCISFAGTSGLILWPCEYRQPRPTCCTQLARARMAAGSSGLWAAATSAAGDCTRAAHPCTRSSHAHTRTCMHPGNHKPATTDCDGCIHSTWIFNEYTDSTNIRDGLIIAAFSHQTLIRLSSDSHQTLPTPDRPGPVPLPVTVYSRNSRLQSRACIYIAKSLDRLID